MRELKFKYFSAENFMCFGEKVEFDLTQMGNIILVRGENLDVLEVEEDDEKKSSNGAGKSTLPDVISYTLYGKPIKNPKKVKNENIIHNKVGKKLRTEVRFDDYTIVRKRVPNKLQVWKGEDEITRGTMSATQELIDEIIGVNYETFANLIVFADQNFHAFLEMDGPQKREIVENLMSLHHFRTYLTNARDEKNALKAKIKEANSSYEHCLDELRQSKERIGNIQKEENDWRNQKQEELKKIETRLTLAQKELEESDISVSLKKYEDAQVEIKNLKEKIPVYNENLDKVKKALEKGKEKASKLTDDANDLKLVIQKAKMNIQEAENEIDKNTKKLEIENLKGSRCDSCYGIVQEENFKNVVTQAKNQIDHYKGVLEKEKDIVNKSTEKSQKLIESLNNIKDALSKGQEKERQINNVLDSFRSKIQSLSNIEKPVLGEKDKLLKQKIEDFNAQIKDKEDEINGVSPYSKIMDSAEKEVQKRSKECDKQKESLDLLKDELPYYLFWENGFSPKGIPKFAIKDITPSLNSQIAYWMQFLIDNKISIEFDSELKETITRNPKDGDPFVYHALSGGERRRVNLAISQAFAHVMMLSSKIAPSMVFLDEVSSNVDPLGVVGIYNMIYELSKEKQVFVTTHDHGLLELLQGCEVLHLRKKDGFTKIVQS
jgi:DNA repair exonuclease SbcCD ATPase subunit